jgi:hypothetical protein
MSALGKTVLVAAIAMAQAIAPINAGTNGICLDADSSKPAASIVRMHFVNRAGLTYDTIRELMRESARIWKRGGVTIQWSIDKPGAELPALSETTSLAGSIDTRTVSTTDADAATPADLYVIAAADEPTPHPVSRRRPLAAIIFSDGVPTSRITAFPVEGERLMQNLRIDDYPIRERPLRLRRELLGRMLGRAIAHEVGHYLFRTTTHQDVGLMRAILPTDELVGPYDSGFQIIAPPTAPCRTTVRAAAEQGTH